MSKFIQVVGALKSARDFIVTTLNGPEDEMHRMGLESNLNREIDRISLLTGTGDGLQNVATQRSGPATTVGGKPLRFNSGLKVSDIAAEDSEIEKLKARIEAVYKDFLNIPSKVLLKEYDHVVIRGIAKKAHMRVTRDEPAQLSIEFIDKVKEAVRELNDKEMESWAEERKQRHDQQMKRIPADKRAEADALAKLEASKNGQKSPAEDKPEEEKTPAEKHQDDNKTPHAEPTKPEEHKIAPLPAEKSPVEKSGNKKK